MDQSVIHAYLYIGVVGSSSSPADGPSEGGRGAIFVAPRHLQLAKNCEGRPPPQDLQCFAAWTTSPPQGVWEAVAYGSH